MSYPCNTKEYPLTMQAMDQQLILEYHKYANRREDLYCAIQDCLFLCFPSLIRSSTIFGRWHCSMCLLRCIWKSLNTYQYNMGKVFDNMSALSLVDRLLRMKSLACTTKSEPNKSQSATLVLYLKLWGALCGHLLIWIRTRFMQWSLNTGTNSMTIIILNLGW